MMEKDFITFYAWLDPIKTLKKTLISYFGQLYDVRSITKLERIYLVSRR